MLTAYAQDAVTILSICRQHPRDMPSPFFSTLLVSYGACRFTQDYFHRLTSYGNE